MSHPGAVQTGTASWYGPGFHGKRTSNGEIYDQNDMTAAHQTLPLGTRVAVTNLQNGRQVEVRINDRGPFVKDRAIDLSYAAARTLDMIGPGTAPVRIEVLGDQRAATRRRRRIRSRSVPSPTVTMPCVSRARWHGTSTACTSRRSTVTAGKYYRVRLGRFSPTRRGGTIRARGHAAGVAGRHRRRRKSAVSEGTGERGCGGAGVQGCGGTEGPASALPSSPAPPLPRSLRPLAEALALLAVTFPLAVWLHVPTLWLLTPLALITFTNRSYAMYGLTWARPGSPAFHAIVVLVVFPTYALGHYALAHWWFGASFHFRWPPGFLE